jgi:hypothetical protein
VLPIAMAGLNFNKNALGRIFCAAGIDRHSGESIPCRAKPDTENDTAQDEDKGINSLRGRIHNRLGFGGLDLHRSGHIRTQHKRR